jgi:hypothetical protein
MNTRTIQRSAGAALLAGAAALMGGCPTANLPPLEYVAGTVGNTAQLAEVASIQVLAPVSDFSIGGGTPVEIVWRTVARSRLATIDVIIDRDENPDNGNEIIAGSGLPLTQSSLVLDTTRLAAGRYYVGVTQRELGQIVAYDYATGRITVNQRPELFFTSPRDNFTFDRSNQINPSFTVSWTVSDPDSVVTVRIFLDPDSTPNGNEILLRESNSQTTDTFSFDLPTGSFGPGTYRLLAIVSDGDSTFPFYAPGSITLRSRLAGYLDLRDIEIPTANTPIRGAVFEGFNPRDNVGSRVGTINDIDGDGFEDFILAAQFGKPTYAINSPRTGIGEAYLIYGRANRFNGRINLNSTGTLFRGDVIGGVEEVLDPIRPSRGITDFAALDDWDRDGVREIAFGIPFTDSSNSRGGLSSGRIASLEPPGYFRTGGVVIVAGMTWRPDLGFPGRAVVPLSSIGAYPHEPGVAAPTCFEGFHGPKSPNQPVGGNPPASTYFYRHTESGAANDVQAFDKVGCRFSTVDFNDQCGETVSRYEFDGLIISTPNRNSSIIAPINAPDRPGAGVVSVYFNPTYLASFCWGVGTNRPGASDFFGYAGPQPNVAEAGLGLPHGGPYFYILDDARFDPVPVRTGVTEGEGLPGFQTLPYSPGFFASTDAQPCGRGSDQRAYPEARNTARFYGESAGARAGNAVAAGDFNADGIGDILIGSPFANSGAGAVYLVFGRLLDQMQGSFLDLAELGLPLESNGGLNPRLFDGVRILGDSGDRLGESQDAVGDFNGDGIADVIIGSAFLNNRRGGAAVVFGSREFLNLTEAEIPYSELPARGLGVIFVGESEGDLAGARVAGVRDVDNDGLDDILIAAPNKSVRADLNLDGVIDIDRTNCGVVYLIYGSPNLRGTISLSAIGTPELPGAMFIGASSDDQLGAAIGEQGDRGNSIGAAGDVDGDGAIDLLLGSARASPRGGRVRAGEVYLIYGPRQQ